MEFLKAEHYFAAGNELGEGPLWHPDEKSLYWVDIEAGTLQRLNFYTEAFEKYSLGTSIGAIGFREQGGLILATGKGFGFWSVMNPSLEIFYNPLETLPGTRMNDGKVDPAGRFWAGGLDMSGNACLYCVDIDHSCRTVLNKVAISNGLDWSLDYKQFYYTDSGDKTIYRFNYLVETGIIWDRNVFVHMQDAESGETPDGLTLDSEGYVWSAHWDGGKVVRYDPLGNAVAEITLPVTRVTSVIFGGNDMEALFITTASVGLSDVQKLQQPLAGDIFICHTGVRGREVNFYKG